MRWFKAIGIAFIVAAAAAFSGGASAQDPGFYLGASAGQSKARDACTGIAGTGVIGACDDKDTAWKVFGGYQFTPQFGVELGYTDLGKFTATGTVLGQPAVATAEAKGVELMAVGTIPITQQFGIYGKAGAFRYDVDAAATVGPGFAAASDRGTELTYGAGVRYNFTRATSARLEWQRYNDVGDPNTTGRSDIDVIGVGLAFKF